MLMQEVMSNLRMNYSSGLSVSQFGVPGISWFRVLHLSRGRCLESTQPNGMLGLCLRDTSERQIERLRQILSQPFWTSERILQT